MHTYVSLATFLGRNFPLPLNAVYNIYINLIGGQILTRAELLALRSLFSEHVISKLTKEGFSIPDIIEKDVATTLQQVQYILKNVGESTTCDQLKEELYSSMVTNLACKIILYIVRRLFLTHLEMHE